MPNMNILSLFIYFNVIPNEKKFRSIALYYKCAKLKPYDSFVREAILNLSGTNHHDLYFVLNRKNKILKGQNVA